jgi:hypothetical protein
MASEKISLGKKLMIVGVATVVGVSGGIVTRTNKLLGVTNCYGRKMVSCHGKLPIRCPACVRVGTKRGFQFGSFNTTKQTKIGTSGRTARTLHNTWCTDSGPCRISPATCPGMNTSYHPPVVPTIMTTHPVPWRSFGPNYAKASCS